MKVSELTSRFHREKLSQSLQEGHELKSSFVRLEQSLQAINSSSAKNTGLLDRFDQSLKDHDKSITQHVTNEIRDFESRAADKEYRKKVLKSLHFPEINCREEEIIDTYEETFQWIFDEPEKRLPSEANLVDWLRKGSCNYWINGKAGSGKSTLMNYIWRRASTKQYLEEWAGDKKLIMPAFFFWASGSSLQMTLVGFLRSVIYQILQSSPELMTAPTQRSPQQGLNLPFGPMDEPMIVWTERKLMQCLSSLTERSSSSSRICLFLDGLDEFSGRHAELVKIFLEIMQSPAIKCCVSDRPEKPFDNLNESSVSMRLEDLTRWDIERYVKGKLSDLSKYNSILLDEYQQAKIVQEIIHKADGVFLWVKVAVDSQITMIENDDDFEMLLTQLQDLPSEVQGLYARMLDKINRRYRAEAARYLQYTKALADQSERYAESSATVFNFTLAEYGLKENLQLRSFNPDP